MEPSKRQEPLPTTTTSTTASSDDPVLTILSETLNKALLERGKEVEPQVPWHERESTMQVLNNMVFPNYEDLEKKYLAGELTMNEFMESLHFEDARERTVEGLCKDLEISDLEVRKHLADSVGPMIITYAARSLINLVYQRDQIEATTSFDNTKPFKECTTMDNRKQQNNNRTPRAPYVAQVDENQVAMAHFIEKQIIDFQAYMADISNFDTKERMTQENALFSISNKPELSDPAIWYVLQRSVRTDRTTHELIRATVSIVVCSEDTKIPAYFITAYITNAGMGNIQVVPIGTDGPVGRDTAMVSIKDWKMNLQWK